MTNPRILISTALAAASLLAALPGAAASAARDSIYQPAELPSVDEVFASAIKAVGGEEAVREIKTLHAIFEMDFQGQKIINDTSWSRDGGRLSKMSVPGMGEILQGTDGVTAWRKSPAGYTLLKGVEAKQFEGQANMYRMVLEPDSLAKEDAQSIEVQAREEFSGADCFRIHYISKDSQEGDVFFNAETGLLVGSRQTSQTPRGAQTTTMTLTDWQETAGVMFFRTVNVQTGGGTNMAPMALKATTLEVNTLPADAFALPDEVKKLAEAQKPEAPAAGEIKLSDLGPAEQSQATEMIDGIKGAGDASIVKQTISSLQTAAQHAPEPQKKMYQYVIQELTKYQQKLEGGR
jgi:hypothetical protein